MKLKDIEKKLKSEQGSMGVPDVLARAKKAPINKLLDGQAPLRAFNKPLATRLLWCAMILLIAIVLCTAVYIIMPKSSSVEYGYVSVTIERGGEQLRYGLVVKDDASVALVVDEGAVPHVVSAYSTDLNSAIRGFYTAKQTDKVEICVFFDSASTASEVGTAAVQAFDFCLEGVGSSAKTVVAKASVERKQQWALFIGGEATGSATVSELVDLYMEKYSA